MKSDPQEPADQLNLLRQQLLLAQVRIMELEDAKDELLPRVAEGAALLSSAQSLVELKCAEAAHLAKVRDEQVAQLEHLRHAQHVTHTALEQARAAAAELAASNTSLLSEVEHLQILSGQLAAAEQRSLRQTSQLEESLAALRLESARHLARVHQLDAEQRGMKSSRSWRWTAWLRSIERLFS